jgi:hypothetical protein
LYFVSPSKRRKKHWLHSVCPNLLTRCPLGAGITVSGEQSNASCRHVTLHFQGTGQLDLLQPPSPPHKDSLSLQLKPRCESNFIAYEACVKSVSVTQLSHHYPLLSFSDTTQMEQERFTNQYRLAGSAENWVVSWQTDYGYFIKCSLLLS